MLGMLKRVRIQGYKSLADVEVRLEPLTVLFGPNAAGKSNFLDALQLLSRLGTSRTLQDAFDSPHRGNPLESFSIGEKGIAGLLEQERLTFSIEADLRLQETVAHIVNQQIRKMRPAGSRAASPARRDAVRTQDLRYRIVIEMLPKSGALRVADEYLAPLTAKGDTAVRRKPFIERRGDKIHVRHENRPHAAQHDRFLNRSVLSMPHHPPHHPHLVAARTEMEAWQFFYLEPRERMRAANLLRETRRIGPTGERLAAFLNTMRAEEPDLFRCVEAELQAMMPGIDGITTAVNDLGDVELRLDERGVSMPTRLLSEGTLRMLGFLALTAAPPAVVGFEEPETGVHHRRLPMIAETLAARSKLFDGPHSQHIVTTHAPFLPDLVPPASLFVVERTERTNYQTHIVPFPIWKRSRRSRNPREARRDEREHTRIWERIVRGDFGP